MKRFGCRLLIHSSLSLVVIAVTAASVQADLWAISTDSFYSRVIRMDNNGNELPGGVSKGQAGLNAPSGLAVSPDGRIFVSSRGSGANTPKILAYVCGNEGQCASDIIGANFGVFADFGTTGSLPAQLKFGPDGNLYVSELFGSTVRKYDTATRQRLADAATGLANPGGLLFASNGDLLVGTAASAEPPAPATISRFGGGNPQLPFFVATQGELAFPSSMLFLPNGDLLAVDLFNDPGQIRRFGPDGSDKGAFAVIPQLLPGKPSFPSDIEFDPDGNILVAALGPNNPGDPGGNQGALFRYTVDGVLIGGAPVKTGLEQIGDLDWTPDPKTLVGNFNGDGVVNQLDYNKWKADFGKFVAKGNGADANRDGIVDTADYTIWRDHQNGAPGFAAGVPEPASAVLLGLGALSLLTASRIRRGGRAS